jgi:hypothetical protein
LTTFNGIKQQGLFFAIYQPIDVGMPGKSGKNILPLKPDGAQKISGWRILRRKRHRLPILKQVGTMPALSSQGADHDA